MSVMYSPALNYSEELPRNPEMDSNIGHPQQHCHQPNSGLLRYRSAPSSLLASLVDSSHGCANEEASRIMDHNNQHLPSSSSEMEAMLEKLISSNNEWSNPESLNEYAGGKPVKQETRESVLGQNGYSYDSQIIYQNQQPQNLQNGNLSPGNGFDGSYVVMNSMVSENSTQSQMVSRNCSNLVRQKSSPAGFFSNLSAENGFASLRELESLRARNGQSTCTPTTSGLNGNMNFSSRPSACSRRMPQIAENENASVEGSCVESRNLGNDNGISKCYMSNFPNGLWEGSAFQKSSSDIDEITFSTSDAFETQNADFGYQNLGLARHLSLPSSSTKMSAMEKYLHIQGSVPCKIRAKRGFATHPRSIAERVRRTRISERIKKLQDLFPKSDKQTSTADMLDLAADYIKDLQKQVKMLTDTRAKCTCPSSQKQFSRPCA